MVLVQISQNIRSKTETKIRHISIKRIILKNKNFTCKSEISMDPIQEKALMYVLHMHIWNEDKDGNKSQDKDL